jgi:hypothetical protein
MRPVPIAVLLLGAGCEGPVPWADTVVTAVADDGPFGDPSLAANGARGAGCCAGGTDVYSLNPTKGRDLLVLAFDRPVLDGSGDDLTVFENPFDIGGDPTTRFMDPVVVSVSADGEDWVAFPHEYTAPDPTTWSSDPTHWRGFAGITPVLLDEDADAPALASDRDAAGGDAFDLVDLPDTPAARAIWQDGVHFVRLEPATVWLDPATGAPYPADPVSDGPDIDAVYGW